MNDSYCLSVANKTALVYGLVNYQNVVALLTSTGLNATPHPTGISIARFAAMVVQAYKLATEEKLQLTG